LHAIPPTKPTVALALNKQQLLVITSISPSIMLSQLAQHQNNHTVKPAEGSPFHPVGLILSIIDAIIVLFIVGKIA
jgi:hypothetical protein